MVELTQQYAVFDAGGAAVFLVLDMVHIAGRRALVATAGPGALLVPQDDRAADRLGDVLAVADVDRHALGVERGAQQAGAQHRGQRSRAGQEVDRQLGQRVRQAFPGLRWQRRPGAGSPAVPGRVQDHGDHLVDDRPVRAAGDHRHDQRVTRGGLGVLSGQVAMLTGPGGQERFFHQRRAGQRP
jgi:hypothetical protein